MFKKKDIVKVVSIHPEMQNESYEDVNAYLGSVGKITNICESKYGELYEVTFDDHNLPSTSLYFHNSELIMIEPNGTHFINFLESYFSMKIKPHEEKFIMKKLEDLHEEGKLFN